ncbi:Transcriptional regulator, MerR family, associated with photolyase [Minicystis rosea]|nr:Transcriptional regulator, MerR family, associated with photolyase [Minicystis rosea]
MRLYTDDDVERLRLVARALKAGYRVGEVIARDRAELESTLGASRHLQAEPASQVPNVSSIVAALARDDVAEIRASLRRALLALGPRGFVVDLAGPLCTAVGDAWARGEVATRQEHVFTEQLTSQLRLVLTAYEYVERPPVVLLVTLPGEQHALGLEMAAVYLSSGGASPRLLGPDLPPEQIADAARALSADVIGLSVSLGSEPRATSRHLRRLLRAAPRRCRIWAGGAGAPSLDVQDEMFEVVPSWSAFDEMLIALGR